MTGMLDDILGRLTALPEEELKVMAADVLAKTKNMRWIPSPGPQTDAYLSEADELFFGGQAGGGKTDLGCGLALNEHTKSLILRRYRDDARDIFDRIEQIVGTSEGSNRSLLEWDIDGRKIGLTGVKDDKDKQRHKGKPYDLYVFDEIGDFLKSQFLFIKTWNRSTVPGQRCRVVCTGNPPTTAEGLWVIEYWAPWLDPKHPNPAQSGEIRHFIMDRNDKSHEVPQKGRYAINHDSGEIGMVEDSADQKDYPPEIEIVSSRSRCFIRSRLSDNPYLINTDYAANLDALPSALRLAYRDGRFDVQLKDDLWQVIPTSWIMEAVQRWKKNPPEGVPMCAVAADIAQGGDDNTVISSRYDGWYSPLVSVPGKQTPRGSDVAGLILGHRRDRAKVIIDMGGGYGGATSEALESNSIEPFKYKGATSSLARAKDGIGFFNTRAQAYWQFREALDPSQPGGSHICLPDDPELIADLTAPRYKVTKQGYKITEKEILVDDLGRSPDKGDAVVMCWMDGLKDLSRGNPEDMRRSRGYYPATYKDKYAARRKR